MADICETCTYCKSWGCNRLVVPGGFGRNDRVARDYMKNGKCSYYKPCEDKENKNEGKPFPQTWNS